MKNYKLEEKLREYISTPRDDIANFELACSYFDIKQYASSISYYLRCAELSDNDDLVYESLLCSYRCMAKTGNRAVFERGQLLQTISHSPHRPEAYLCLCGWLEFCGSERIPSEEEMYHMMYSYACIGISNITNEKSFKYYNEYEGYYALLYYKALAGWYIGKNKESKDIWYELWKNKENNLGERYKISIDNNIKNLNLENHGYCV
tara:strand:- start:1247 stop:1864 length:618 start_codon:yes stop_codon:yes gene_type:complete